jgi:dihydroorotate dehydrogenase (NAD+) catalytic subunit
MNDAAPDLSVTLGKLALKNPVMTASGTFGYGLELRDLVDLERLGAIIVKGLSLQPARGNPPARIVETPCGMLNAIGLENIGIEAFVSGKLPRLRQATTTPVIANLYGTRLEEYVALAERVAAVEGIAAIEVNISCPNVSCGGMAFGVDALQAHALVQAVRRVYPGTLIVKLTPNVTDIAAIAGSVEDAGADVVSLINTLTGMAVDVKTRRPRLANITGGLSGPAIKPVAVRMVWQVARRVSIPVIGIGGIQDSSDALEFLIAGATAIQVGTASFVNPRASVDVLAGLERFLVEQRIASIQELIGTLAT